VFRDGLRVVNLCEEEWNFSGLDDDDDQVARMAARHEYMRENPGLYEVASDLVLVFSGQSTASAFLAKWKWRGYDPLNETQRFRLPLATVPWMLAREFLRLEYRGETYRAVKEIKADEVSSLWSGETRHRIAIDWNKGIEAVQSDMRDWVRAAAPRDMRSRKGRESRTRIEDSMAQLAAWRARRAGVKFGEFNEMLDMAGIPSPAKNKNARGFVRHYRDPSAYRNAADVAEARIKEMNREYELRWKDSVREDRAFWDDKIQIVRDAIQRMTQEAETFRVQMEQKKREAKSLLSELARSKRKAEKSREK
jgi:hypothetical protein